jgi:hypothetical protein
MKGEHHRCSGTTGRANLNPRAWAEEEWQLRDEQGVAQEACR